MYANDTTIPMHGYGRVVPPEEQLAQRIAALEQRVQEQQQTIEQLRKDMAALWATLD